MTPFRITAVSLFDSPVVMANGEFVAALTIDLGPILITGARLLHVADSGEYRVLLPQASRSARVILRDPEDTNALTAAALAAYRALCGAPAVPPFATASPLEPDRDEYPQFVRTPRLN